MRVLFPCQTVQTSS